MIRKIELQCVGELDEEGQGVAAGEGDAGQVTTYHDVGKDAIGGGGDEEERGRLVINHR
jgi:hypothetical protein